MLRPLVLFAVLTLGASVAQDFVQQPGPGGPPNLTPQMQKKFQEYRPVFELTSTVRMLAEVDAQKGLAFTKAQAQKLLPILKDLQTRTDLKPADANKILSNLEDNILTPAQLKWMDETQLKRQQEARQRAQQGEGRGGGGFFGPGGQGGQNGANRPGGGRGGLFQAILQGKPFNPFKEGRAAENLQALITLLSKR